MTSAPPSSTRDTRIATVLVATDLSDASRKALRYAGAVAKNSGAELHVVHVSEIDYAIPGPARPGSDPFTSETKEGQALKEQIIADIGQPIAPIFHGRVGRAYDQICRCAEELRAGLVIMATHGRSGLKRFALGSNAERVVQHSTSPVLIVRAQEREIISETQELRLQSILVPTDFSESSRAALSQGLIFARRFHARLVLFHSFTGPVFTSPDPASRHQLGNEMRAAAEAQMREFILGLDSEGIDFQTEVRPGPAAEAICDFAAAQEIDLIVISTHGRTGLKHVLIGSVAEHVVRSAPCPVLVVPQRQ